MRRKNRQHTYTRAHECTRLRFCCTWCTFTPFCLIHEGITCTPTVFDGVHHLYIWYVGMTFCLVNEEKPCTPMVYTVALTHSLGTHLASPISCADGLAPRRGAVQLLLIAPARARSCVFLDPHPEARSLPRHLSRLRIEAFLALLRPPERDRHERVDHRPLQRDGSLKEGRCGVWRAEDRREHRSGP